MNKEYLVTKSNYFIMNSSYDLSLEEQKLILTLASMVQPEDKEFKPYVFKINEFMKLLGVDTKTKYTKVPKITKELMKKVFEIQEGKKIIQVAWLSSVEYEKGSGKVELQFSPKLKPYMLRLNKLYTSYKLANILNMRSKYSPRVYEILKANQFKTQGFMKIKVEELRKLLKAENVYPLYADFKRKIIKQTQKELKKLTDINFEFEEIKTGRKVTSLKFIINSNNKLKNQISATKISESLQEKEDDYIKKVKEIMFHHVISSIEAKKIYDSSNKDLDIIEKVYEHFKNKNSDNFIGLMIAMVKPGQFKEPLKNDKIDTFNDYDQRSYDFEKLEKELLGWDDEQSSIEIKTLLENHNFNVSGISENNVFVLSDKNVLQTWVYRKTENNMEFFDKSNNELMLQIPLQNVEK